MRNYIKILASVVHFTGAVQGYFACVSHDRDELMGRIVREEQRINALFGTSLNYSISGPFAVYYELNAENFATLMNWTSTAACLDGLSETNTVSPFTGNGLFAAFTTSVSPRPSWSHGH